MKQRRARDSVTRTEKSDVGVVLLVVVCSAVRGLDVNLFDIILAGFHDHGVGHHVVYIGNLLPGGSGVGCVYVWLIIGSSSLHHTEIDSERMADIALLMAEEYEKIMEKMSSDIHYLELLLPSSTVSFGSSNSFP
ncbi:hypothetical protein L1887_35945 [Cichorium endivia]|nr:hypothetical protein L1887_35945 [Cichorium endivia]